MLIGFEAMMEGGANGVELDRRNKVGVGANICTAIINKKTKLLKLSTFLTLKSPPIQNLSCPNPPTPTHKPKRRTLKTSTSGSRSVTVAALSKLNKNNPNWLQDIKTKIEERKKKIEALVGLYEEFLGGFR